jgi:hypothetical protein
LSLSHCAIGEIRYRDGETGELLYIKASVTGDEREEKQRLARRRRAGTLWSSMSEEEWAERSTDVRVEIWV